MTVLVKCDCCPFSADIDAEDCPDRLELWCGGDLLDGSNSSPHVAWHACKTCKAAFFAHVPEARRKAVEAAAT